MVLAVLCKRLGLRGESSGRMVTRRRYHFKITTIRFFKNILLLCPFKNFVLNEAPGSKIRVDIYISQIRGKFDDIPPAYHAES